MAVEDLPIRIEYSFSSLQCPDRSWERVDLCRRVRRFSEGETSGGLLPRTEFTPSLEIDELTAFVWMDLRVDLYVAGSTTPLLVKGATVSACFE